MKISVCLVYYTNRSIGFQVAALLGTSASSLLTATERGFVYSLFGTSTLQVVQLLRSYAA